MTATAVAGGFAVAQQGALAGGTGHAGLARTEDAALAWLNPAALADGEGFRGALGLALAASRSEARQSAGAWGVTSSSPLGLPPHLYGSVSWKRNVVGLAVHTPFAGGLRWPDDWPLATQAVASAPTFVRIAPFVGRRMGRFRMAIGPHIDVGRLLVSRRTDHVTELGWARIQLAGAGLGFDVATWVSVSEAVAIGVTYKSRTALALSGWADFDVPPSVALRLPDQRATAAWRLPDRLAVGGQVGWTQGEVGFRIVTDVEVTTWSVNRVLTFDFEDPKTPDTTQVNRWRDTLALRGGLEATVAAWTLRVGGYLDGLPDAPPPKSTLSPSSPDGLRLAATLGAGFAPRPAVRIDGFLEWLRVLARTSTAPEVDAVFRTRALVTGLTVTVSP